MSKINQECSGRTTATRDRILQTAAHLAAKEGYQELSRSLIARRCKVSDALISFHFNNMTKLRSELMKYAVENESVQLVAQGLANGHPVACKAPKELKAKAAQYIAGV